MDKTSCWNVLSSWSHRHLCWWCPWTWASVAQFWSENNLRLGGGHLPRLINTHLLTDTPCIYTHSNPSIYSHIRGNDGTGSARRRCLQYTPVENIQFCICVWLIQFNFVSKYTVLLKYLVSKYTFFLKYSVWEYTVLLKYLVWEYTVVCLLVANIRINSPIDQLRFHNSSLYYGTVWSSRDVNIWRPRTRGRGALHWGRKMKR